MEDLEVEEILFLVQEHLQVDQEIHHQLVLHKVIQGELQQVILIQIMEEQEEEVLVQQE
jgi:hypothetical protein